MKKFEYVITDPVGIHARPAGLLAGRAWIPTGSVMTYSNFFMGIFLSFHKIYFALPPPRRE